MCDFVEADTEPELTDELTRCELRVTLLALADDELARELEATALLAFE